MTSPIQDRELLPCPFDGGEAVLEDCRTAWIVRCKCGATVLGERAPEPDGSESVEYWNGIRQSAIAAWNRRSPVATDCERPDCRCLTPCVDRVPVVTDVEREKLADELTTDVRIMASASELGAAVLGPIADDVRKAINALRSQVESVAEPEWLLARIALAAEAIAKDSDMDEAYHQLYLAVDPQMITMGCPFTKLDDLANKYRDIGALPIQEEASHSTAHTNRAKQNP